MSELENKLTEMGADNALNMTNEHNAIVRQLEEAKGEAWRIRMPNTAYRVGDKVIVPGVANTDRMLQCTTAGTTANTAFPGNYSALAVGNTVTDGSVKWSVVSVTIAHKHAISDVTNLQTELNKIPTRVGYPNYTGAISVGSVTSYTAPSDGWCGVYKGMDDSTGYPSVKVNGVEVFKFSADWMTTTFLFPVKKGDVITLSNDSIDKSVTFYPNR